eukprot:scaffold1091_cov466-Pavlova_lutheri.AAC.2
MQRENAWLLNARSHYKRALLPEGMRPIDVYQYRLYVKFGVACDANARLLPVTENDKGYL